MIHSIAGYRIWAISLVAAAAIGLSFYGAPPASAHGGKSHGDSDFTSFQAVQKAAQLYDRLITAGKLDDNWETGLSTITVTTRNSADKKEHVVRFRRSKGDPGSVYFFFDDEGQYTGSNFSGK